ncbi:MAG: 1-deoxy-D-xylulose-5-phosphate synthase [Muribaculaceae bacterium]|nr:1-deoxy-D-xylulose-5-phosphate synthase [Muribaculaceae bacterium]
MKSIIDDASTPLLNSVNSPSDLRKLELEQLPKLCEEIREFLISHLSVNPGHFASSMGAVDIIVALHYVFNTPDDRLVWDVGHQAYAHKILTGRRDAFATQRTLGGISGFPNPMESPYDTFVAGHAGNSISAALGMAIADMATPGAEKRKTVAIVGDASISGGLAFEGLNNASNNPNNLLIILNDNDMSIDGNVGALHSYLSDLTTSAGYNRLRNKMAGYFRRKGILTEQRKRAIIRFNNSIKSLISRKQNIFEGLNIRYFGPFDGHDVIKIVKVLQEIKDMEGPRILHLCTVKGKGYQKAEENPTVWHAPGKFDPETGERFCGGSDGNPPLWQEVFGETLTELAKADDRVMGITAAMPTGTSLCNLLNEMPRRAFDVGISEGHAVTFAGGLAAAGKRPFVAIYSSFLQRAYDNIIHDVAIQGLPVTFCIDRAGIVGEDGVTHHGLFDIAYLRCVPLINIACPADEETMRNLMHTALSLDAPLAIRYPRGRATTPDWKSPMKDISPGKGRPVIKRDGAKTAILTLGPVLASAREAVSRLDAEGILADIYDMIWVKPLDTALLTEIAGRYDHIVTVEDGAVIGGFGSAVNDFLKENGFVIAVTNLGVRDEWIGHGAVDELKSICGYDTDGIMKAVTRNPKNSI